MTASTTFGRRQPPAAARPASAARPAPAQRRAAAAPTPASSLDLDPRAEAFRAELAAGRGQEGAQTFGQWRASQAYRGWIVWILTLLSFTPGVVSVVLDAPVELSAALEIAAVVGNVWIRRERYRRRREILAWEDPREREVS